MVYLPTLPPAASRASTAPLSVAWETSLRPPWSGRLEYTVRFVPETFPVLLVLLLPQAATTTASTAAVTSPTAERPFIRSSSLGGFLAVCEPFLIRRSARSTLNLGGSLVP